jgi:hypothetical protein
VTRLSDAGVDAVEGGEADLGWDSIRFDDRDGVLIATTKDGHDTRRTRRRDDVTQLLWTLSAWDRVQFRPEAAAVLGLPIGYVGVVDKERGVIEVRAPKDAVVFSER